MHPIAQLFLSNNGQSLGPAVLLRENEGSPLHGAFHQTMLEASRMGRSPMQDDLATLDNRGAPSSSGLEHDSSTAHYRQPGFASHATLSSATPSPVPSLSLPESGMLSRFAPSKSSDSVTALFVGMNKHQALSEAARGTASALSISPEKQLAHSIAHLRALAQPQDRTSTALSAARDTVAQQPPCKQVRHYQQLRKRPRQVSSSRL